MRALADAAVGPGAVDHFELARADAPEADALAAFLAHRGAARPANLGALALQVGSAGAAGGVLALVRAAQALYQQVLPAGAAELPDALAAHQARAAGRPRFWLANDADGPRRAAVAAAGCDGTVLHAVLEEDSPPPEVEQQLRELTDAERAQPLGNRPEAAFALEADSAAELDGLIAKLAERAARRGGVAVEQLAREWFLRNAPRPTAKLALAVVARSVSELAEQLTFAREAIRSRPRAAAARPGRAGVALQFARPRVL